MGIYKTGEYLKYFREWKGIYYLKYWEKWCAMQYAQFYLKFKNIINPLLTLDEGFLILLNFK